MSTLDSAFLILGSIFLSLFFIILTFISLYLFMALKRVFKTAESALNGVEAASDMIRHAAAKKGSLLPLVALVKYLFRTHNQKRD